MCDNEKLVKKIQNLLSKTVENGCTAEEAQLAYAKARTLMANHKISESEVTGNVEEDIISLGIDNINTSIKWVDCLVHTFCKYLGVLTYYIRPGKKTEKPVIFGHKIDVEAAITLIWSAYQYVEESGRKYATDYRKLFGSAKNIKQAYSFGFVDGLRAKYEEQNKSNEKYALMCLVDKDVKNKYDNIVQDMNISEVNYSNVEVNKLAFGAGFTEGYSFGTTPLPEST